MKIDIVYTWVDGSDKNWLEKKNSQAEKTGKILNNSLSDALFKDNDELKYSLRSINEYAPWINNIFIVTDNQIPNWLNLKHPKIKVIDHKDIFIDKSHLPTFSARAIECNLHRIKDLEENFIYFNDDMFLGKKCSPDYFFAKDGKPFVFTSEIIAFPNSKQFNIKKNLSAMRNSHHAAIFNTRVLLKQKLNKKVYARIRHGLKPLKKSILFSIEKIFYNEILNTSKNSFRTNEDILPIHLFEFYILSKNLGKTKYLITSDITPNKFDLFSKFYKKFTFGFINMHEKDAKEHLMRIRKAEPFSFCINQTPETPVENLRKVKLFLAEYFPNKSPYEI